MNAKFLKVAGVKDMDEFYTKYPDEETFIAKCGAKIKKAYPGIKIPKNKDKAQLGAMFSTLLGGGMANGALAGGAASAIGGPAGAVSMLQQPNMGSGGEGLGGMLKGITSGNPIGMGIDILQGAKAQRKAVKQAKQTANVMEFMRDAKFSNDRDEQINLQRSRMDSYVRPEDNTITGEELFPMYGVGTNVLAKDGKTMKYQSGGSGFLGMTGDQWKGAGMQGINTGLQFGLQKMGVGNDMGSMIGNKIGGAAGSLLGPVGGMVGGAIGSTVGDLIDRSDSKIKKSNARSNRAINQMMGLQMGKNIQSNFHANLENGGTMKYGMEGEVMADSNNGSGLTPISDNPYRGKTDMIKGPAHSKGGVDMNVMGKEIEAEGGEPIQQTSEGDMAIMGNLEVPSHLKKSAEAFTGEKFSGKKFKNVSKSIAESEDKYTNKIKNTVLKADKYSPLRPLGRISLNTLELNNRLHEDKLQKLAVVSDGMATAQEALNGNEAYAKYGARFPSKNRKKKQAQGGANIPPQYQGYDIDLNPDDTSVITTTTDETTIDSLKATSKSYKGIQPGKGNNVFGRATQADMDHLELMASQQDWFKDQDVDFSKPENLLNFQKLYNKNNSKSKRLKEDGLFGNQMASVVFTSNATESPASISDPEITANIPALNLQRIKPETPENEETSNNWNWLSGLNQMFRGTNAEEFNNTQLLPEVWAMANNQLEPVQAQKYNPRLRTPYDISMQDQLNQNTAKARQSERMLSQMGPQGTGALSALKAEEYMADQRVLGEQFRQNQAFKDQVYSQNLQTLNDANLKNLAIADTQYARQEQAKSNTKATDLEAIKSMTDKRLKHHLENQTLRVWENMYNYRYDKAGRAWYVGEPADLSNWEVVSDGQYDDSDRFEYYRGPDGKTYRRERTGSANYPPNIGAARAINRVGGVSGFGGGSTAPGGKNGYMVKKLKTYK